MSMFYVYELVLIKSQSLQMWLTTFLPGQPQRRGFWSNARLTILQAVVILQPVWGCFWSEVDSILGGPV